MFFFFLMKDDPRSCELNLCNCVKKPEKIIGLVFGNNEVFFGIIGIFSHGIERNNGNFLRRHNETMKLSVIPLHSPDRRKLIDRYSLKQLRRVSGSIVLFRTRLWRNKTDLVRIRYVNVPMSPC